MHSLFLPTEENVSCMLNYRLRLLGSRLHPFSRDVRIKDRHLLTGSGRGDGGGIRPAAFQCFPHLAEVDFPFI